MVLVDTSVWSLALRRRSADLTPEDGRTVAAWAELVRWGRIRMIGPIRQELLSGVRSEKQFVRLQSALRAFPDETIQTQDYEAAARDFHLCRARGLTATHTDMLICSVAARRNWSVFTAHGDFERFARVLPVRLYSLGS